MLILTHGFEKGGVLSKKNLKRFWWEFGIKIAHWDLLIIQLNISGTYKRVFKYIVNHMLQITAGMAEHIHKLSLYFIELGITQ